MAIRIAKMHFTDHQGVSKVLVTFSETEPDNLTSSVFTEASWQRLERLLTKTARDEPPMHIVDES